MDPKGFCYKIRVEPILLMKNLSVPKDKKLRIGLFKKLRDKGSKTNICLKNSRNWKEIKGNQNIWVDCVNSQIGKYLYLQNEEYF